MPDNTPSNWDFVHIDDPPHIDIVDHRLPLKLMTAFCIFLCVFCVMSDYFSTYFLFRDYPDFTVKSETNRLIVAGYNLQGLDGIFPAFLRMILAWVGVGIFGGFISYVGVIQFLDLYDYEKVFISILLGITLATCLNFGAGLSNTVLYFKLRFGW